MEEDLDLSYDRLLMMIMIMIMIMIMMMMMKQIGGGKYKYFTFLQPSFLVQQTLFQLQMLFNLIKKRRNHYLGRRMKW